MSNQFPLARRFCIQSLVHLKKHVCVHQSLYQHTLTALGSATGDLRQLGILLTDFQMFHQQLHTVAETLSITFLGAGPGLRESSLDLAYFLKQGWKVLDVVSAAPPPKRRSQIDEHAHARSKLLSSWMKPERVLILATLAAVGLLTFAFDSLPGRQALTADSPVSRVGHSAVATARALQSWPHRKRDRRTRLMVVLG